MLSKAQQVGIGSVMGAVAAVGTSMILRYYADNKGTQSAPGQPVDFPVWWEHAPLIGIAGGAAAAVIAYYVFGKSWEAAIACGMTALAVGVAPEADDWIQDMRAEADAEAAKEKPEDPADSPAGYPRGSDVIDFRARLAALEGKFQEHMAQAA